MRIVAANQDEQAFSARSRTERSLAGLPMLKMRPSAHPSRFSMMRMSASMPSSM
jgi:hypothetical protein